MDKHKIDNIVETMNALIKGCTPGAVKVENEHAERWAPAIFTPDGKMVFDGRSIPRYCEFTDAAAALSVAEYLISDSTITVIDESNGEDFNTEATVLSDCNGDLHVLDIKQRKPE